MNAELVLYHGTVHPLQPPMPDATAIAFGRGRVLFVGGDDEVLALRGARTRIVDLAGRAVFPGFIDAHVHLLQLALARREVDVTGCASAEEAAARVAVRARTLAPGSWIRGGRFDPQLWPGGAWPAGTADRGAAGGRALLDAAAPGHPVVLSSKDLHSCWASSAALAAAGLGREAGDPPGGRIERDARGEPTGILRERAAELLLAAAPAPTVAEAAAATRATLPDLWAEGLTGGHEILDTDHALALRTFQELRRQGQLGLRVVQHIPLAHLEQAIGLGVETGLGDEWLRIGGVKLFADGALGSRTALMLEPYCGTTDARGVAVLTGDELAATVARADAAGIAVAIHAIGDRAVREALDALERMRARSVRALRHRIEHVQLLHPDDLPRLARLGAVASMQPIHATSDLQLADEHWGKERSALAYAWRSILDSGARLCFGSDAPVERPSVLAGLHAAVTRRRADGTPGPEGWVPAQRLSIAEALAAFTGGAAWAAGEERLKGSLAPGKLGDAVVLSRDLLALPPEQILETRVELTVLGGRVVYEAR